MNKTIETLLNNRIGFGEYQKRNYIVIGLIEYVDGMQQMFNLFLPAILQNELKLDQNNLKIFSSLYFIGALIGALITAAMTDHIGRRNTLLIGNLIILIAFVHVYTSQTYSQLCVSRFLFGVVLSFSKPISQLLIQEMTPKNIRGRTSIFVYMFYIVGKITLIYIMYMVMMSITEGNFRKVALINLIPCIVVILLNITYLDESIRLLIMQNKVEEAICQINKAGQINDKHFQQVTLDEIDEILKFQQILALEGVVDHKQKLYGLFSEERFGITWRLVSFVCLYNFVTSGIFFIMPFIFEQEDQVKFLINDLSQGFYEILLTVLSEIPAILILYFIIDLKKVGRLNILNIAQVVTIVVLILMWKFKESFVVQGMMLMKFLQRFTFAIGNPIFVECYNTVYRMMGNSVINTSSKIVSAVTPFIVFDIYKWEGYGLFAMMAVVTFVTLAIMRDFPSDGTGQDIDARESLRSQQQYQQIFYQKEGLLKDGNESLFYQSVEVTNDDNIIEYISPTHQQQQQYKQNQ